MILAILPNMVSQAKIIEDVPNVWGRKQNDHMRLLPLGTGNPSLDFVDGRIREQTRNVGRLEC